MLKKQILLLCLIPFCLQANTTATIKNIGQQIAKKARERAKIIKQQLMQKLYLKNNQSFENFKTETKK